MNNKSIIMPIANVIKFLSHISDLRKDREKVILQTHPNERKTFIYQKAEAQANILEKIDTTIVINFKNPNEFDVVSYIEKEMLDLQLQIVDVLNNENIELARLMAAQHQEIHSLLIWIEYNT